MNFDKLRHENTIDNQRNIVTYQHGRYEIIGITEKIRKNT